MKTVSLDQLHRHALAIGAELEMNGAKFNTARAQVAARLAAPNVPPETPPSMTRIEVAALIAERDVVWQQQIDHLTQAFSAALKAVQLAPKDTTSRVLKFNVTYDEDKCVTGIVPVYVR